MTRMERANFLTGKSIMEIATGIRKVKLSTPNANYSEAALKAKVDKGRADLAAGRGKVFTIEELEDLLHESA